MNNKGQSLVLFVLIIPIILGIAALVIDVGKTVATKNSINNKIEMIIECGLVDDLTKEELVDLAEYNLSTYEYVVDKNEQGIAISVSTYVEGIFSNILNFKGFNIESEYHGIMSEEEKVIIEKVKW